MVLVLGLLSIWFDDPMRLATAFGLESAGAAFALQQVITPLADFVVVTNPDRAGGGGNFPGVDAKSVIPAASDTNRDVIVRFIHERCVVNPSADGNWRFAPVAGATATFESSPKALAFIGNLAGFKVEDAGAADSGFEHYRITL